MTESGSNDEARGEARVGLPIQHLISQRQSVGVNSNTVLCRLFDVPFVAFEPNVECPIIGRTGGAQCLESNSYFNYFSETF